MTKIIEKHHPEGRRLLLFKMIYAVLFSTICIFLIFRQVFQADEYQIKERKQGQRRIINPGARGDVLDRNGNLLIGNRANFAAVLHVEQLKQEIWQRKVDLRRMAYELREILNKKENLSLGQLIIRCYEEEFIRHRKIRISGESLSAQGSFDRIKVFLGNQRIDVDIDNKGTWSCEIPPSFSQIEQFRVLNAEQGIRVNAAGLFSLDFDLGKNGFPRNLGEEKSTNQNLFASLFSQIDKESSTYEFSTSGFSLDWEARLSVVEKYLHTVNRMTKREKNISMEEIRKHWNRRLVMPLELATDLFPSEYAALVENIPTDSPLQVQAKSVRHYPQKSLAAHVLGYVGSGYQAKDSNLSGSDLATFEVKGRTGKAGVEKKFDETLRGEDGSDIWRVNPMGYRFERMEKKASQKGKSVQLSLDQDLQNIAEKSLYKMVQKVASNRVLPDEDWQKTIERRTKKALQGNHETEVRAELLISAFVDAPFPLSGKQASTVAGFKGTQNDANRLLRRLYAEGVLSKPNDEKEEFALAPPMLPPAAAVLLDLETQEVLVLASMPTYNLQNLTPFISQSAYDKIQRKEAWLPRAYHPGYAPASPFKLVTALAGARNHILNPEEKLLCEGIYRGMECHVFPGKHGELNLKDAISQSCNVYFFRCAEKIGHKKLIEEAKNLGFSENPSLELPTLRDSPIVPDPLWKKKTLGVKWTLEDTFNISIGQGGLRQSPLQMACFAAKIGKKVSHFEPSIIKQNSIKPKVLPPLEVNATSYGAIIEGMHLATIRGTARRCQIEGISIAGKTGTGQWRNRNMELNLAWFIGFAPVEKPRVAIAVLVEGVIPQDQIQGGLTATPVAREILAAYFSKYNKRLASSN